MSWRPKEDTPKQKRIKCLVIVGAFLVFGGLAHWLGFWSIPIIAIILFTTRVPRT